MTVPQCPNPETLSPAVSSADGAVVAGAFEGCPVLASDCEEGPLPEVVMFFPDPSIDKLGWMIPMAIDKLGGGEATADGGIPTVTRYCNDDSSVRG